MVIVDDAIELEQMNDIFFNMSSTLLEEVKAG